MREDRPGRRKRPRKTSPSRSGIALSAGTGNRWKGQGGFPNRKTRWSARGVSGGKEPETRRGCSCPGVCRTEGRDRSRAGAPKRKGTPRGKIAHIRFILWGNEAFGGELDGRRPFRGDDRWRNFPAGHPAAAGWLKPFRFGAASIPGSPSDASPGMASAAGAPVWENPFFLIVSARL
jgi:hypothetical protein